MAHESYYELLYMIDPGVKDEEVDVVVDRLKGMIAKAEGTVMETTTLGRRRLGYPVQKLRQGNYLVMDFTVDESHLKGLNHALTMAADVIRHTVVKRTGGFKAMQEAMAKHMQGERERAEAAGVAVGGHGRQSDRFSRPAPAVGDTGAAPSTPDSSSASVAETSAKETVPAEQFSMEELDKKLDEILKI